MAERPSNVPDDFRSTDELLAWIDTLPVPEDYAETKQWVDENWESIRALIDKLENDY